MLAPLQSLRVGVHRLGGRFQAIQIWAPVWRLAGHRAAPELLGWQSQPGAHHQARRHLSAHAADPGGQVRRDERGQTRRPHQPLAQTAHRARGLAKSLRGDGQQERPHPVGGDDARARFRCPACQRQTACRAKAGASARTGRRLNAQHGNPRINLFN